MRSTSSTARTTTTWAGRVADADRDDLEKPQGPTDPSGSGGIDAPAPPGGPQRTDVPSGGQTPRQAAADPAPEPEPEPDDEPDQNDIPEPVATQPEQSERAREAQEENAASSLDQPSQ